MSVRSAFGCGLEELVLVSSELRGLVVVMADDSLRRVVLTGSLSVAELVNRLVGERRASLCPPPHSSCPPRVDVGGNAELALD